MEVFDVGATVETVDTVTCDSDEVDCGGDTWLVISCRIHSCCSGENMLSAVVDTAIIIVTSTFGQAIATDTVYRRLFQSVLPLLPSVDCRAAPIPDFTDTSNTKYFC